MQDCLFWTVEHAPQLKENQRPLVLGPRHTPRSMTQSNQILMATKLC